MSTTEVSGPTLDDLLDVLHDARTLAQELNIDGAPTRSRALSVATTYLDTAILWVQEALA